MTGLSVLLPSAQAAGAVVAALPATLALRLLPMAARRGMLLVPILLLAGGVVLRQGATDRRLLAADLGCCFGLAVLALTVALDRQPPGLARMARAAGAGWAATMFHAVLRPILPVFLVCLAIGIVLPACDFGFAGRLGPGGGLTTTLTLLACATVGLALLLGTRTRAR